MGELVLDCICFAVSLEVILVCKFLFRIVKSFLKSCQRDKHPSEHILKHHHIIYS